MPLVELSYQKRTRRVPLELHDKIGADCGVDGRHCPRGRRIEAPTLAGNEIVSSCVK